MKCNIGKTDRIVRAVIGLIVIAVGIYLKSWWGAVWPVANRYICYRAVWTVYPFWNIHVQDKGINVRPTVGRNSFFLS
jgi:Inner membrane protein YgaP-like, transmembrane domain